MTDGVFLPAADQAGSDAPPTFLPARPITQADLAALPERIRRRVIRGPHGRVAKVRYLGEPRSGPRQCRPPGGRPMTGPNSCTSTTTETSCRPHPTSCPRSTSTASDRCQTPGQLGDASGSVGTAAVSSGTWASSTLYVGLSGTGTLNVAGGVVRSLGTTELGRFAGSVGTATVSSGTWDTGNFFYIGDSGTGTLNVTGGVVISNTSTFLGYSGNGMATVSSGTWANRGLAVGFFANSRGVLNVSGGTVTSNFATIAPFNNSIATSRCRAAHGPIAIICLSATVVAPAR